MSSRSGDTNSNWNGSAMVPSAPAAAVGSEAEADANQRADRGEDRDALPLAARHRVSRRRRLVALHLHRQRAELDLGRLRPGEEARQAADEQPDDEQDDLGVHQAASAASFLAFSTACSMVPTM